MTDQKIVERIRKLLALATSDNVSEGASGDGPGSRGDCASEAG